MTKASYTAREILRQLDRHAKDYSFPMLNNAYVDLADVRLTSYRTPSRWAIIIETVGFFDRSPDVLTCLDCFGNCLLFDEGTENNCLSLTNIGEVLAREFRMSVRPGTKSIRIRDQVIPITLSRKAFQSKGIELCDPPMVQGFELMRSLVPEHRELLLATEDELRQRVPSSVPDFIRMSAWHHPDLANDELPSKSETFQMLADALVSGDRSRYACNRKPNTHWSNWPMGGTL